MLCQNPTLTKQMSTCTLFLENLFCTDYGKCHSKHEVQNRCEILVFMCAYIHALPQPHPQPRHPPKKPQTTTYIDRLLCRGDLRITCASMRIFFQIIQFNLHLGLQYVPAFPSKDLIFHLKVYLQNLDRCLGYTSLYSHRHGCQQSQANGFRVAPEPISPFKK